MNKLLSILLLGAVAGCNVNTEIEIYSDDLIQETAANELSATVRIVSFGDRSMCDMISSQAHPIIKRIFPSGSFRECVADASSQINAIFDTTLPLYFGDTFSSKPAIRIKQTVKGNKLSWIYIDMPNDGLKSLIDNSSLDDFLTQQDIAKSISFKFVNSGKKNCHITAASAYINGTPYTSRDEITLPLVLSNRKSASIRLSDVTIDAVSQYSTNLAFMAYCEE